MRYSRQKHHSFILPLFDWADQRERTAHQSYQASHIQCTHHVSPVRARLLAEQLFQGGAR